MERVYEERTDKKIGISFRDSVGSRRYVFGNNIDELIDGLELLNDGNCVNKFICNFPDLTETQLVRLDTIMLRTSNAKEIVEYAIKRAEKLSNRRYIEKRLVELRKVFDICKYAENCQVNNIDAFVDVICEEKESYYAIKRIAKVDGANLFKLKKAIFQIDDIYELIGFCSYFQNKTDNIITQEDVQKVEQLVIDKDNACYACVCAEELKGVNIVKLQYIVENSGSAEEILDFAKYVGGADIAGLRKAILKTKDTERIAMFIKKFGPVATSKRLRWFSKKSN